MNRATPIPELLAQLQSDSRRVIDPHGKDLFVARAPGRLDVIGGSADYTGSLVCELPIAAGAAVVVQRRDDRQVVVASYNPQETAIVRLSLDDLYGSASLMPVEHVRTLFQGQDHWAAYVIGAYYALAKQRKLTRRVTGANIAVYSTVPQGAGVGSSAALEVAAISAIAGAYHIILDPQELSHIAHKVENQVVGSSGTAADQMASAVGRANQLLLLKCQPHSAEGFVDIPPGVQIMGIYSGVLQSATGIEHARARMAAHIAQMIITQTYKDFGLRADPSKGYLANIAPEFYRRYLRKLLPKTMSGVAFLKTSGTPKDRTLAIEENLLYAVRASADHQVLENHRSRHFATALEEASHGSIEALHRAGKLLTASHQSARLRAFVTSPYTDQLITRIAALGVENGIYGARATGSGPGGTVVVLCDSTPAVTEKLQQLMIDYSRDTGLTPMLIQGSSGGAAETPADRIHLQDGGNWGS